MGVKRLDDLQVGEVGFIKIDVGGHDSLCYEVPLKRCGATDRCSSSRRKRHYPNAVGEVLLLSQFGYSGYFEVDGTPDGPSMNSMPKSTKTRQT